MKIQGPYIPRDLICFVTATRRDHSDKSPSIATAKRRDAKLKLAPAFGCLGFDLSIEVARAS